MTSQYHIMTNIKFESYCCPEVHCLSNSIKIYGPVHEKVTKTASGVGLGLVDGVKGSRGGVLGPECGRSRGSRVWRSRLGNLRVVETSGWLG